MENDRLYVSDSHCRIQRFRLSDLQPLASWGSCGAGNAQLERYRGYGPESLVVDWS